MEIFKTILLFKIYEVLKKKNNLIKKNALIFYFLQIIKLPEFYKSYKKFLYSLKYYSSRGVVVPTDLGNFFIHWIGYIRFSRKFVTPRRKRRSFWDRYLHTSFSHQEAAHLNKLTFTKFDNHYWLKQCYNLWISVFFRLDHYSI